MQVKYLKVMEKCRQRLNDQTMGNKKTAADTLQAATKTGFMATGKSSFHVFTLNPKYAEINKAQSSTVFYTGAIHETPVEAMRQ